MIIKWVGVLTIVMTLLHSSYLSFTWTWSSQVRMGQSTSRSSRVARLACTSERVASPVMKFFETEALVHYWRKYIHVVSFSRGVQTILISQGGGGEATGCYDMTCPGFVQISPSLPVGFVLRIVGVYGQGPYDIIVPKFRRRCVEDKFQRTSRPRPWPPEPSDGERSLPGPHFHPLRLRPTNPLREQGQMIGGSGPRRCGDSRGRPALLQHNRWRELGRHYGIRHDIRWTGRKSRLNNVFNAVDKKK